MNNILQERIKRTLVIGLLSGILGGILGYISTIIDQEPHQTSLVTTAAFIMGLVVGTMFGILEEFSWRSVSHKIGYRNFNLVRFIVYLLFIVIGLMLFFSLGFVINEKMGFMQALKYYIYEENFFRDIILSAIVAIIVVNVMKLRRLLNYTEISSLFTGKYFYPEEEERIILFADIAGSTAIAEQLTPLQYSSFIRRCFIDVSEAVLLWKGETYQHVGDGIVITWKLGNKRQNARAIHCYFEMQKLLHGNREKFKHHYGIIPLLRGGIHSGTVIRTWVGEARRELAFHGDTINTASRIQGLCKKYDQDCLVSSDYLEKTEIDFHTTHIGELTLRGKAEPTDILAVTEKIILSV